MLLYILDNKIYFHFEIYYYLKIYIQWEGINFFIFFINYVENFDKIFNHIENFLIILKIFDYIENFDKFNKDIFIV